MNRRVAQAVESMIAARRAYVCGFPFPTRKDKEDTVLRLAHAENELSQAINEEAGCGRSEA